MNILPKKRWHVRTRENIARVRKDEAEAAEEEKKRERRVLLAEQEARTAVLRERARKRYSSDPPTDAPAEKIPDSGSRHVNLFEDLEAGNVASTQTNVEHEKEKKEEKEKYEKQIGYLTYLGQDSKQESWYDKPPDRSAGSSRPSKSLQREDPINDINKYLRRKSAKSEGKGSLRPRSGGADLATLREERLRREQEERQRADKLLRTLRGEPEVEEKKEQPRHARQMYNSQFNPHLAKQNYKLDDHKSKR